MNLKPLVDSVLENAIPLGSNILENMTSTINSFFSIDIGSIGDVPVVAIAFGLSLLAAIAVFIVKLFL